MKQIKDLLGYINIQFNVLHQLDVLRVNQLRKCSFLVKASAFPGPGFKDKNNIAISM